MGNSKYLVINADDLGYNLERDEGIFECFLDNRSITSASILANGTYSNESALRAMEVALPVGLHFNITEGAPVATSHKSSSLTNENGHFKHKLMMVEAAKEGTIDRRDVKAELLAQIQWYQETFGTLPHHVDGHQHVHVMPIIRDVFCETLEEQGIHWTRLPKERGLDDTSDFFRFVSQSSREAVSTLEHHNIEHTETFVGIRTMGKQMSTETLQDMLLTEYASASTCELMVHPGYACKGKGGCGVGADTFSRSEDREHEMRVLRSPSLKEILQSTNIHLVSFKELDDLQTTDKHLFSPSNSEK